MDGLYINGKRPTSKKAVKEAIASNPSSVSIECTSMFGGFDGLASDLPIGKQIHFVGPDPYNKRKFYGTIANVDGKLKVS